MKISSLSSNIAYVYGIDIEPSHICDIVLSSFRGRGLFLSLFLAGESDV